MGLGLGAVHGAWVGVGGWVSGLCVGLGTGARGCVCGCCLGTGRGLTPVKAAAGGSGLGPTATRVSWGSFRAQLGAWLTLGWVLAPGVLRLNQAALAHASGRQLRLLPRQRYLRAERAEVSALERKRNVLCCLITRILKVEKQLHIDNLVFRVWRA